MHVCNVVQRCMCFYAYDTQFMHYEIKTQKRNEEKKGKKKLKKPQLRKAIH